MRAIPSECTLPILITQHLPSSFMPYFAAQLAVIAGRPCDVATDRARIRPGRIVIAPGDAHLGGVRTTERAAVRLDREASASGCMPSVDPMFAALADVYGDRVLGVVLRGMGRDGSIGARALSAAGASVVVQALTFLYRRVAGDLVVDGGGGAGGEADIDRWIRLACTQAGAAGFMTNMGGLITLPLALPANLAGTAAVQMRMIAKIAAARGYDTGSDEVRSFVFACLLGNAAADVLKGAGIRIGVRVSQRLSGPVLKRLNQAVVTRLLTRFGAQGATSFVRFVPVVSGLIGGGLDIASTRLVGAMAKRVFVRRQAEPAIDADESAEAALTLPAR